MNELLYTVKEISEIANVTIKTLHHYHKLGLLLPCTRNEAGYRLYGMKELERLQQILFYRELDFPLEKIMELLEHEPDRLSILANQKNLLLSRKQRLDRLIQTIDESISCTTKGETMDTNQMFKGFANEQEWTDALAEQRQHLKEAYEYDLLENNPIDVEEMNEQAIEAIRFLNDMANAVANKVKFDDENVRHTIALHLEFLNQHGHGISASDFALQARFFLQDDFHRNMLESQQIGLAYYLCAAAESFAGK